MERGTLQRGEPEPEYAGFVHVQYRGKGKFQKVWLSLAASGELAFRHENASGKVLRIAFLREGCSVTTPKQARKHHEHALRVDIPKDDSEGDKKYILSAETAEELARLRVALVKRGQDDSTPLEEGIPRPHTQRDAHTGRGNDDKANGSVPQPSGTNGGHDDSANSIWNDDHESPAPVRCSGGWAKAQQVKTSLSVARAFVGDRFKQAAAASAAARRIRQELAPDESSSLLGRSIGQDSGMTFGSSIFIPAAGESPERMAITVGVDQHLMLFDAHNLSATPELAIDPGGEMIMSMRLAPNKSRACAAIGLGATGRIAMFQVDGPTPWPELWRQPQAGIGWCVDFSADSSVVAAIESKRQYIDLYDAESGALRTSIPFGVAQAVVLEATPGFSVRFSPEFLVVSGGFGTPDEQTVAIWRTEQLGMGDNAATTSIDTTPHLKLTYEFVVGPISVGMFSVSDQLVGGHRQRIDGQRIDGSAPITRGKNSGFIAVGGHDGRVIMHELAHDGSVLPERRIRLAEPRPSGSVNNVMALAFSQDCRHVAAAWASGEVKVFSTCSTAPLFAFQQDDCSQAFDMSALAISPDGGRIAVGGACCGSVRVHQISPMILQRFCIHERTTTLASTAHLAGTAVSAQHIALALETRLVVLRHNGDVVMDIDTTDRIEAQCRGRPLALRPDGEHIAVVLKLTTIAVYDIQSSKLVFTLGAPEDDEMETETEHMNGEIRGSICEILYSFDSSHLFVSAISGGGCWVVDATTGRSVLSLTKGNGMASGAYGPPPGSHSTCKRFVMTNWGGTTGVKMVDLESGVEKLPQKQEIGCKYIFPCVDADCSRFAYGRVSESGKSNIVIRNFDDIDEVQAVIDMTSRGGMWGGKGFSPGDGNLLLQGEFNIDDSATAHLQVYDCKRGVEPEWSSLLPVIFGAGYTSHNSIGWVPGVPQTIHATANHELLFMKVTDFEIMLADGCFGAQLLIDLCGPGPGYRPEMIRALVARFPQCVNVQKWRSGSTSDAVAEDGDTVLHYCAKIGSGCQGAVEQWLPKDTEVVYTPIRNNRQSHVVGGQTFPHWTALHEAISRSNKTMALHLLGALTTTMNDFTSEIITDTITLMTMKMPHLVPQMLVLIEKRLLLTEGVLETKIHYQDAAFVAGRDSLYAMKPRSDGSLDSSDHLGSVDGSWGIDPRSTKPILPSTRSDSREAPVNLFVLQVANFIGFPTKSPFSNIVQNCEYHVCNVAIMKAAVDFKWKLVRPWVHSHIMFFAMSLCIASIAVVQMAWENSHPWERQEDSITGPMIVLMCIMEIILLSWEVVLRERWLLKWNMVDLLSSLALLMAVYCHSLDDTPARSTQTQTTSYLDWQLFGSFGLGVKWMSSMNHMSGFQRFSKVLTMVQEIAGDVKDYLVFYFVAVFALGFFSIANMPYNAAFTENGQGVGDGLAWSMAVAFQAGVLGDYEMNYYVTTSSKIVFGLFSIFGILIVLNLLIAVMGDSFERVKAEESAQAMFGQAKTIVEWERLLHGMGLWQVDDELMFPKFMLIAEEQEGKLEKRPEGISGRVHRHLDISTESVTTHIDAKMSVVESKLSRLELELQKPKTSSEQMIKAMDAKIDAVDAKIDAVDARLERVFEKLDAIAQRT